MYDCAGTDGSSSRQRRPQSAFRRHPAELARRLWRRALLARSTPVSRSWLGFGATSIWPHTWQESDYYPQGPYADGGGEADSPQHCDHCGLLLENPLTGDGNRYVNEKLTEYARDGSGTLEVLEKWSNRYNVSLFAPGSVTLEDLQFDYSLEDDEWSACMGWWFGIAGELHTRGAPIPEDWQYKPGLHPVDPDDRNSPLIAGARTEVLMRFMEDIEDDAKRLKAEGKDY
jgi:hypothetical protein